MQSVCYDSVQQDQILSQTGSKLPVWDRVGSFFVYKGYERGISIWIMRALLSRYCMRSEDRGM